MEYGILIILVVYLSLGLGLLGLYVYLSFFSVECEEFCTEMEDVVSRSMQMVEPELREGDLEDLSNAVGAILDDVRSLQFYASFPAEHRKSLRKAEDALIRIRSWVDNRVY